MADSPVSSAATWEYVAKEAALPCVASGLCAVESHTYIAPCAKAVPSAALTCSLCGATIGPTEYHSCPPTSAATTKGANVQQYRKKPVVIEAMQWDGTAEGATPIINWVLQTGKRAARYREADPTYEPPVAASIRVDTLEGTMWASPGDWIVRGVKDEFYPVKPDIFEVTYEPA